EEHVRERARRRPAGPAERTEGGELPPHVHGAALPEHLPGVRAVLPHHGRGDGGDPGGRGTAHRGGELQRRRPDPAGGETGVLPGAVRAVEGGPGNPAQLNIERGATRAGQSEYTGERAGTLHPFGVPKVLRG